MRNYCTSLVNKILDSLKSRVAIGNIGLDQSKHILCSTIDTDKYTIVNLSKSEELENLFDFGTDSDNTANSNYEHQFLLRSNEYLIVRLGGTSTINCSRNQFSILRLVSLSFRGEGLNIFGSFRLGGDGGRGGGSCGGLVPRQLFLLHLRNRTHLATGDRGQLIIN